jgi:hypothetical protein
VSPNPFEFVMPNVITMDPSGLELRGSNFILELLDFCERLHERSSRVSNLGERYPQARAWLTKCVAPVMDRERLQARGAEDFASRAKPFP